VEGSKKGFFGINRNGTVPGSVAVWWKKIKLEYGTSCDIFLIIVEIDESVAGWLSCELVRHNLQRKCESGSGSNDIDKNDKTNVS
jgi:hypothetical protein